MKAIEQVHYFHNIFFLGGGIRRNGIT
jgi:hypothetical protein